MSLVTEEQRAFAQRMSERQWDALRGLARSGSTMLSASESGNSEIRELIDRKLAQCFLVQLGPCQCFAWYTTRAGHRLVEESCNVELPWAGPSWAPPPRGP